MTDAITTIRLDTDYGIDTGVVHATVFIGEAQRGKWEVSIGEDSIGEGREPKRVEVGSAADLAGKTLVVEALVTDTNPTTNLTSVRITLEGGIEPKTNHLQHVVDRDGGSVFYVAHYLLMESGG
jgi:hypothetical protein